MNPGELNRLAVLDKKFAELKNLQSGVYEYYYFKDVEKTYPGVHHKSSDEVVREFIEFDKPYDSIPEVFVIAEQTNIGGVYHTELPRERQKDGIPKVRPLIAHHTKAEGITKEGFLLVSHLLDANDRYSLRARWVAIPK